MMTNLAPSHLLLWCGKFALRTTSPRGRSEWNSSRSSCRSPSSLWRTWDCSLTFSLVRRRSLLRTSYDYWLKSSQCSECAFNSSCTGREPWCFSSQLLSVFSRHHAWVDHKSLFCSDCISVDRTSFFSASQFWCAQVFQASVTLESRRSCWWASQVWHGPKTPSSSTVWCCERVGTCSSIHREPQRLRQLFVIS